MELQNFVKSKGRGQQTLSLLYPSQPFVDVVIKFQAVRNSHIEKALDSLRHFPHNEATSALNNIAQALKC